MDDAKVISALIEIYKEGTAINTEQLVVLKEMAQHQKDTDEKLNSISTNLELIKNNGFASDIIKKQSRTIVWLIGVVVLFSGITMGKELGFWDWAKTLF